MGEVDGVPCHPVLGCVAAIHEALTEVAGSEPVFMSAAYKRVALLELTRAGARLEELQLRILAAGQAAGDVAQDDGSRDAAAWLAHHARLDPGRARHLARLACSLGSRWTVLAAGLRAGEVTLSQADVIAHALGALPEDLDPGIRREAEARLVAEAAHFDPRRLRILGRRILDVIAPEVAEAHEAGQLADEEAHAARATFLRVRRRGDGTTELHARLSDAVAERLLSYLHAYTSPRQPGHTGRDQADGDPSQRPAPHQAALGDRRPYDQRMGHALGALLEHTDPARMPLHGGDATTVMVTIDLDTLRCQLSDAGVATVGDAPITAAQARRLACSAKIIPTVLGGQGEVLDLGRARRLFSPAQRRTLALHHPTCAAAGCDIPAPWCEAHHAAQLWSRGGATDLADGTLLCSHHHHVAHDTAYETTRHPDGSIRFHRRV